MNWCGIDDLNHCMQGIGDALKDGNVLLALCGVVLILLFLTLLRRRQPTKILAYHSENGRVMVSRSAILELVQSACRQIEQVHRPTVRIRSRRGVCHLKVGIKLESGGKLRDLDNALQLHLRQSLTETLGIEQLGNIDITATGFKNPAKEPKAAVLSDDADGSLGDFR